MLPAALVVFLSACLHEDVAILAAGYLVLQHGMSPFAAAALAFAGMMANNLVLYWLGSSARGHPWVRRWLAGDLAVRIRRRLERHLVATLALSRLGQSMLTPALLGCGCLHLPLRRVLPAVAATAAVYLTVMLALVITLGQSAIREFGNWLWAVPILVVLFLAFLGLRRQVARKPMGI